jgi:predicted Zn-dependent peptidase
VAGVGGHAAAGVARAGGGEGVTGVAEPVTTTRLPNGVTLVQAPITTSRNVALVLTVRAGSRDESPQTAGLAHLLEHLFFTGTPRRPTAAGISSEVDLLGASTNASTDTEAVAYYADGPAAALPALTDLLTDMLCHALCTPEDVERERRIVLQELADRLARPRGWITDRMRSVAFGGDQPMSWTAAGDPEVIAAVSREEVLDYRRTFYAPEAAALVVSGGARLDPEVAVALLADLPAATPRPRRPAMWGQGARYVADLRPPARGRESQVDLAILLPGIPTRDPQRSALAVMVHILGGGASSRLFRTLRGEHGLCYQVSAEHEHFEDTGLFVIGTTARPEDSPRAVELCVGELRRMAAEPVAGEELQAAKAAMIGSLLRRTETARGTAHWYAARWLDGRLDTPDERADAIRAVTAQEVMAAARRIGSRLPEVRLALVGPEDRGEALVAAAGGASFPG